LRFVEFLSSYWFTPRVLGVRSPIASFSTPCVWLAIVLILAPGLSLQEASQITQTGKPPALSAAGALKGGPPDLLFAIAGLPQTKQIG
jgi:hypothetical protein